MLQHISIGISIGSLIAAWIAIFIAYRSHTIAKHSLLLSEEQAARRRASLVPYLIDGFVSTRDDVRSKIYAFSISLTNRSDIDNSIANIELLLSYYRPKQPMAAILSPHNAELGSHVNIKSENIIPSHAKVAAHQTVAGWVLFEYDQAIINDVIIDSYEIRVTDSNGLHYKLQPIIVRELIHEKESI